MALRLRDVYGLLCCADYEELLNTYTPIWTELDDCQTYGWQKFIYTAAQQLGVPLNPSSEQEGHLCLEDPSSHAVAVAVLQQLLARGERHAPELWADVVKHVHNGIPSSLRPLVWPVLLRPAKAEPQQHACWTAAQYKPLLELHKQLFAAVKGSAAAAQKQDQQDLRPGSAPAAAAAAAAPGLQDLQALVSASGLTLGSEQLVEWRVGCRTWASQIEKDVHRTFPGHDWLSSPVGQACLTRLLSCFCLAAPHLGYCQGMNYVAGSLLLLLGAGIMCQLPPRGSSTPGRHSRQHSSSSNSGGGSTSSSAPQPQTPLACNGGSDAPGSDGGTAAAAAAAAGAGSRRVTGRMLAPGSSGGGAAAAAAVMSLDQLEGVVFECLLGFAERVLPGYYSPAMVAPQVDQRVLSHLATEHLPTLTARLTVLGLSPAQPCPAWLLAGFAASSMPLATVARLWDVAFFERSGAAFIRACLALLHLFSAAFDAALDCCDAGLLLQALPGLAFDSDRLLMLARDVYSEVNPDTLMALQHCFRAEVLAEIEQAAAAARKQQAATPPRPARPAAAAAGAAVTVPAAQGSSAVLSSSSAAAATSDDASGGSAGGGSIDASIPPAAAAAADAVEKEPNDTAQVQGAREDESKLAPAAASIVPEETVTWEPDFDEAAVAAAASASAGGSVAGTGATAAAATQQKASVSAAPAAATDTVVAATGRLQQQQAAEEEGDEEEEETGSLLGPQQQQQQQQQQQLQQQSLGGVSSRGASRSTSMTGRQSGVAAGGSSGGSSITLKTHSLEVSRSKAIAQAMSIAAVPGLPVLPCIAVTTPKQQQQQQYGGTSADGSAGRGGSFLRSLGVQRQAGGPASQHSPPSPHQQQQQQHMLRSQSSSKAAAAAARAASSAGGEGLGPFTLHHSYSSGDSPAGIGSMSAVRILAAAVEESSDFCEDVEGTGWMLLGGSSPRVAAAAAAAAAAASCSNGSGGSSPAACGSPTAAAAGCNLRVLCDTLRESYGLAALTAATRELAAAVQPSEDPAAAAAGEGAAGVHDGSKQQQRTEGASVGGRVVHDSQKAASVSEATSSNGGSNGGSSGSDGLPGRCLALAQAALAAAEQLVGDLAQQTAIVTALQCQLDRSMGRLEQPDAELASKDEAIEQLQQQLNYYESLSNGGASSTHSPRKGGRHPHHQQQQQYHSDHFSSSQDGGAGVGGRNSLAGGRQRFGLRRQQQQQQQHGEGGCEGVGGQGFVAAALARFGSPTKGRGPGRA